MNIHVTINAGTIDTSGQAPYEQCGYCHEYDGNSLMPSYPKLAEQTPLYIKKQLRDFRSGKRKGQMQATAELLSDDDIEIVASYFSLQKVRRVAESSLPKLQREIATRLFYRGDTKRAIPACISCHGTGAQGVGVFPRLAGQHEDYLTGQLKAFKSGTRTNDDQGVMGELSKKLSDIEIDSLSGYLSGLSVTEAPSMGNTTPELFKKINTNQ